MTNRLKACLGNIILEEQRGFLKGKQIVDGIIISDKTIYSIKSICKEGMVIKLDINKEFNRISWHFLIKVLLHFGFQQDWCDWILSYISLTYFFVLVNDIASNSFEAKMELRQGDPLSPFLFIVLVESLGRDLKQDVGQHLLKGLNVSRGINNITHLHLQHGGFTGQVILYHVHSY